MNTTEQIIHEVPKGLLEWYDFIPDQNVLLIDNKDSEWNDILYEVLQQKQLHILHESVEKILETEWQKTHQGFFQYVVAISSLELYENPVVILQQLHKLLCPKGHLLLGMNNRLGLRYFCGDRDIYTDTVGDGIENYRRAYQKKSDEFHGRMYAMSELKEMLQESGWKKSRFISVLPDLKYPQLLYAEGYLPNEDLARRLFPMYHYAETVFLEEEVLYRSLIDNGMFHAMANAYLIECSAEGELSDVAQVTSTLERGEDKATFTIIHGTDFVEKKAAYPQGCIQLKHLYENQLALSQRGIPMVEGTWKEDTYQMPFVQGESAQICLRRLFESDLPKFLEELDILVEMIYRSSEIEKEDSGDGNGAILTVGYPDMVLINCFYADGTYHFFDQEFTIEHCPVNLVIYRMIYGFYYSGFEMARILPVEELYKRYGVDKKLQKWEKMEHEFIDSVRNDTDLGFYHRKYCRNGELTNSNRQKLNYSQDDYQRLFVDIFKRTEGRKLILFGSGIFARKFLTFYGKEYPVYAIVDNSKEKWGTQLEGVTIQSPDKLRQLEPREYKVIICIKNYSSVMRQLEAMGVKDYAIYDSHKDYPHRTDQMNRISLATEMKSTTEPVKKKYAVGYVAGVFDMFHVGHLNLLKKAKEQCEYLIAGVLSDESVYRTKHKKPIISCEDRVAVVQGCRYVDQVEALPSDYAGIQDAYKMFHFDVQFSGNDHADHPDWLADKEFLQKNGADIVFFDYTQKVSSTMLREQILK